jgi:hypothetical protein
MPYVFNPFTGTLDDVKDVSGYVPYTGATDDVDLGNYNITVNKILTNDIENEDDDLTIKNTTSDKDVIFNINKGGTTHDFFKIDSSIPQIIVGPDSTTSIGTNSIMVFDGTYVGSTLFSALDFQPSVSGANFLGFYSRPTITDTSTGIGYRFAPTLTSGSTNKTANFLEFVPTNPATDKDITLSPYSETINRSWFGAGYAGDFEYTGFKIGGACSAIDFGDPVGDMVDTHIHLTGGGTQIGGSGSITQTGIKFTGYGNIVGSSTVRAIEADGGLFSLKSDSAKLLFGAGEDAEIYYDGTDLNIKPDVVGSGKIKLQGDVEVEDDLDLDGELLGGRAIFQAGYARFYMTGSGYLDITDGVHMSATRGVIMPRAGSIVGFAVQTDIDNYSDPAGTVDFQVKKGTTGGSASTQDTVTLTVGGAGVLEAHETWARGTYTFSAGDFISIYGTATTSGTLRWNETTATIEVQFDT